MAWIVMTGRRLSLAAASRSSWADILLSPWTKEAGTDRPRSEEEGEEGEEDEVAAVCGWIEKSMLLADTMWRHRTATARL